MFSPELRRIQNHIRGKAGVELLPDPDTMLFCTKCGTWKPDEEFYNNKAAKHRSRRYRSQWCKSCDAAAKLNWRLHNIDHERAYHREKKRRLKGTDLSNLVRCECGGEFVGQKGLNSHRQVCETWLDSQQSVV